MFLLPRLETSCVQPCHCLKVNLEEAIERQGQGGWNSSIGSMLGWLSCLMQHCGFDPPLRRIFLVEEIFPLGLTWVLTPFPPKLFRMRV